MPEIEKVARAITVLAPLLEEVVQYIESGKKPDFFDTLPATMRSRVALEAARAHAESSTR